MSPAPNGLLKSQSLEFLSRYQKNPSTRLRNRLVQINLGLVRLEAHRYMTSYTDFDDLTQVGSLGLVKAIERFDLQKGVAFSSFAIPYIRGEIRHYLRDKGTTVRIPRRWQGLKTQSTKAIQKLQAELNRQPSDQEVADELAISIEDWQQVRIAMSNRQVLSLDKPVKEGEGGLSSFGDLLPDSRYQSFQLAQEDQLQLQQALSQLEQGTREVLEAVFLQDLTQKETAKRLGLNAGTVSSRVKRGIHHLRKIMKPVYSAS